MRPSFAAVGILMLSLFASARPALAAGWPVTHKWSDQARPNDPTSGSFAYEYGAAGFADAQSMVASGVRYDCADFAITVLCDYASKNGLEIVWTMPDPANGDKVGPVSSNDPRFTSAAQFTKWSRDWINAKMVGQSNTVPTTYADWRAGDVVLMRWNQLGTNNPFFPRDVWHTYLVGNPGKILFYGNEIGADNAPAPITETEDADRLAEVQCEGANGPAVYGQSPRRWKMVDGAIVAPSGFATTPQVATVTASALNERSGPSTKSSILGVAKNGATLPVLGVSKGWVHVRLPNGSDAYVGQTYVTLSSVAPTEPGPAPDAPVEIAPVGPVPIAPAAPSDTNAPPRTGIVDALGNFGGN